ncbi:MAG TPA: hypothetical protein VLA56_14530, partial [Pseudomonadales bacterium]|nr:hypothetical protein [Pseudomonadales bacterium]
MQCTPLSSSGSDVAQVLAAAFAASPPVVAIIVVVPDDNIQSAPAPFKVVGVTVPVAEAGAMTPAGVVDILDAAREAVDLDRDGAVRAAEAPDLVDAAARR